MLSLDSADNIMMIGPTKAGKTTLLSVLRLAAAQKMRNAGKVRITPVNDAAQELFRLARDIVHTGSFQHPGTIEAGRYEFQLTCNVEKRVRKERWVKKPGGIWPWSADKLVDEGEFVMESEEKAFNLSVIDGKGGDILGGLGRVGMEDKSEYETRRRELVELATKSSALVVCINASDNSTTGAFFGGLQTFLDDVHRSGKNIPFQRVVFAMTQADKLVEQYGSAALSRLEDMNPAEKAGEAIGRYAKGELFEALSPAARKHVYAGWVSVYGFVPSEGSVNFDSSSKCIAIFDKDDAKWTDDWVPHGVIEPFLFACTGSAVDLERVSEPD